ncbi:hypothetical protein [Flavisphingomonas formosensis]|uniref:hypothetical protein n=1 Tax=Flavisphingomonas formosensis TaxID=861534 RepID=UPI0012F9B6CC|nr:hypothetical protein [Sphingomonas formosensis]
MPNTLSAFQIARESEGYLLTLTSDDGERLEVIASFEQLDLISEEISRQLDRDEENELGMDEESGGA